MPSETVEKFHLQNLDCPSCAAKIEDGLNRIDAVRSATVDFASLKLHVSTDDIQRVVDEVRRMDPDIELVPESVPAAAGAKAAANVDFRKEIGVLLVAALLFGVLLALEAGFLPKPSVFLEPAVLLSAYFLAGWNIFRNALGTVGKGFFFDENLLMVIATAGAIAIGAYSEAVGVMLFYKIGELLQDSAVSRSRRSIQSLLDARPDRAFRKTAQGIEEVSPESVRVDDVILVRPGEKVPLDGEILAGDSRLNTSALTGESVPVSAGPGDAVMAGQINKTGALTVRVTRPFGESSIARVMDLVENATARKAKTEKFMTTLARYYTPAVVLMAAGIATIPPLATGASFEAWIYRALVLLVISCPCALVVSIPLGYFGGIGKASRRGILVKGSNFIDALAAVRTVVFDKTGTLTQGVFTVREVGHLNGFSASELLEFAAAAEFHSTHPIAAAIVGEFQGQNGGLDAARVSDHAELSGQGVSARYKDHRVMVGNDALLHARGVEHPQCVFDHTVAHVVVDDHYAGYIAIGDEIKPDAEAAMGALRRHGVEHIAMFTGDNACSAQAVAGRLGLDSVYWDLLPEDKVGVFERLERKKKEKTKIAFVGDGINDAPVLARADVGVAMGGLGSDAAIETADVVLMNDDLTKMAEAVSIARETRRIVWQNIVMAFAIKGVFIVFGAVGMATMWGAVFADVGTALLAVANSTRIIGKKLPETV